MQKIIGLFILFTILINSNILALTSIYGYSEELYDKQQYTKNINFNKNIKLEGVSGNHRLYFQINKFWDIQESSYLELIFSQSNLNSNKNSSLTVYINNQPIHSASLYDKKLNIEKLRIKLPKERLNVGFNELEIKTYHRIGENLCEDEMNPGNWLVLHNESYLHIEYKKRPDSNKIIEYPYPYLDIGGDAPLQTTILLPDSVTKDELTAAMIISADFGKRLKNRDLDINIFKFQGAKHLNKSNIIFIGSVKNIPKELLNLITDTELEIGKDKALIKEVVSPYNSRKKMLLILSRNSENLVKASQTLTMDRLIAQMGIKSKVISKFNMIEDMESNKINESSYMDLDKLGYSNVQLKGLFNQSASFDIEVPENWIIEKESKIELKIRYSKALDFQQSMVTAYINDVPIGSKKLVFKGANNDIFEMEIPKDVREDDYYNLRVSFYLILNNKNCNHKSQGNAWAYISNKSKVYLNYRYRKKYYLENYVGNFVRNNTINDLLLILPQEPSTSEIKIASNIIAALGTKAEDVRGIKCIKEDELNLEHSNYNIIAIGIPQNSKYIRDLNNSLYIKFNNEFDRFDVEKKKEILEEYNSELASIQLIQSPFNENKQILVLTSNIEEGLKWGQRYLSESQFDDRLKGNAIMINELGNISWVYYDEKIKADLKMNKELDDNKEFKRIGNKGLTGEIKSYIIFLVFTLALIIISSLLIIRRNKR